jgi:anti-sigma B factor antagonist
MAEAVEDNADQTPASKLSVSAEKRESGARPCTVVTLAGRVDEAEQARLREALQSYTRWGPPYLLVDLSAVPAIDVTGVRELVRARSVMEGLGGVVALVAPQPEVGVFLEACGADQLMPVYPSVTAAMIG